MTNSEWERIPEISEDTPFGEVVVSPGVEAYRRVRPTLTLTDFLLARIAEDERAAAVTGTFGQPRREDDVLPQRWDYDLMHVGSARWLAECEAKRRIVEVVGASSLGKWRAGEPSPWAFKMLGALAAVYADHPDYRDDW